MSLVVQRLRLHTPSAGGLSSIHGQETRCCIPQLRPSVAKLIIIFKKTLNQL